MARVNKPRKDPQSGIWTYPASALALEEVGLETIGYYIQVRRQHIAAYIVDQPIFGFCEEGGEKASDHATNVVVGITHGFRFGEGRGGSWACCN